MRFVTIISAAMLAAALAAGCSDSSPKATDDGGMGMKKMEDAGKTGGTTMVANANPDPKSCPVSGHPIDNATFVDLDGKKYAFCCGDCIAPFKADPKKYLASK